MAYNILVHELAAEEMESLRTFDRRRVITEIREQLTEEPTVPTRRRKCLVNLSPAFEHELPVWELRVGDFRVFYDVNGDEQCVHIRAVRRKGSSQRTEDIT